MDAATIVKWMRSGRGMACLSAVVLGLAALTWWAARTQQRSKMREILNSSAPITNPPMELQFPARQPDTPGRREALQPGVTSGYWVLRNTPASGQLEVLLTREGQKHFSTVGNTVVAGFHAGTRLVNSVDQITDTGTTRQLSFTYTWTSVQPGVAVLGSDTPALGRNYRGQALLVRSGDSWQLAHWSLPEFEFALQKLNQQ